MTPPIHISMATPTDVDAIATIISRAMAADLVDVFQFGDNHDKAMETKRALCRATFPASLADPDTRIFKASLQASGTVVAFASLSFQSGERPAPKGGAGGFPEGMDAMYYGRMGEGRWRHLEGRWRHLEGRRHVAWSSLHVLPEYQRLGIGSALLAWGFGEFGLEREIVYIGTQMRGRNLYRRYGWEDVEFVDIDLSEWGGKLRGYGVHRSPIMLRQPGKFERIEGMVNE